MAKAIRVFTGSTPQGTRVKVVLSDYGQWYGREYRFNNWGNCWSRWQLLFDFNPAPDENSVNYWCVTLTDTTPEDISTLKYRLPR